MRTSHPLAVAMVLALLATQSKAAEPDAAARSSARRLGEEAGALYDKGDYAGALEKYQRAAQLVSVPTLGVRIARCLEKLGRLVEASERYLVVTRTKLPPDALDVHKRAVEEAASELAALLSRIPALVVTVPEGASGVEVTIDGKPLPAALFGEKASVNPGHHVLVARAAGDEQTREVDIQEGAIERVDFDLAPGPKHESAPASGPSSTPTPKAGLDEGEDPGWQQRSFGYIGLGLGGVGLAVGAGAGLFAAGKKSDLEDTCGSSLDCPPSAHGDADSYNRMRTISTVGFIVGAVSATAGATLLFTAPSRNARKTGLRVEPARLTWFGTF